VKRRKAASQEAQMSAPPIDKARILREIDRHMKEKERLRKALGTPPNEWDWWRDAVECLRPPPPGDEEETESGAE
jgi:hypothetical protein